METVNIRIEDNGSGFLIVANGLIVEHFNSLGRAWEHIEWMYVVASQKFTVGKNKIPVDEWVDAMYKLGYIEPWNLRGREVSGL